MSENVTLYALDNDTIGVRLTVLDNFTRESDNSNTGNFTVALLSQPWPGESVTVNLQGINQSNSEKNKDLGVQLQDNDSGPQTSFITLTFDNSSWNTAQKVTVFPVNDLVDEGLLGVDNQTWNIEVLSGPCNISLISTSSNNFAPDDVVDLDILYIVFFMCHMVIFFI